MKIGFFTSCFPELSINEIAKFAAEEGFQTLEVAAWPLATDRHKYAPAHLNIDALSKGKGVNEIKELMDSLGLEISSLGYYPNNLHPDNSIRERYHDHLKKVIVAAEKLGVNLVGTFIGRNPYAPLDKELQRFRVIFPPLVKYAEDHGVKLMIENCPVTHLVLPEGFPMGMNIAYSPAVWRFIFEEIPNPNFGLNFDPSHLYWLGIFFLSSFSTISGSTSVILFQGHWLFF